MNIRIFLQLSTAATLLLICSLADAQLAQLGGGGGGTAQSATAAGGGRNTPTTEGIGGMTTQGLPTDDGTGGTAGGNIVETFIGGNENAEFVGGAVPTQMNSNRQFRGITTTDVPTGGNAQTSGTPRRIATRLRIAFPVPPMAGTTLLIGAGGTSLQKISVTRPELRNVAVNIAGDGVATLTGYAPDAGSRRLAANIVRLRPGVRKVENKVLVAAQ